MADNQNNETTDQHVDENNATTDKLVEQIIERVKKLSIDQQKFILRQLQKFEYMERRQYKRFRCENLVIGFDVEGLQSKESLSDISEGGAFIKTKMPVTVGQKAILTFSDTNARSQYRINSTIVRAVKDGVALVFDADNAHQRLKIKTLMTHVKHVGYLLDD
ncbi:MAG: PilZ domain-containing protein [Candidatus Magnetomorum sp.]|nr:PilZ domain-containing protein [Candidatus Magnetomorum sp.]